MHHGQGNLSFFKYNRLKLLTSTINKPVLPSSVAHTSSASNLTQTPISSQLDNRDITTNQNKNNISNTDDIQSCVTPKKNYSVQATSTSPHLTPLNATLHIKSVKLHRTTKLNLTGKTYLFFLINKKNTRLPSVSSNTHSQYLSISTGLFYRD